MESLCDLFLPVVQSQAVEEHDTWQHAFSETDDTRVSCWHQKLVLASGTSWHDTCHGIRMYLALMLVCYTSDMEMSGQCTDSLARGRLRGNS